MPDSDRFVAEPDEQRGPEREVLVRAQGERQADALARRPIGWPTGALKQQLEFRGQVVDARPGGRPASAVIDALAAIAGHVPARGLEIDQRDGAAVVAAAAA